jgi:hypothetical protein
MYKMFSPGWLRFDELISSPGNLKSQMAFPFQFIYKDSNGF